MKLLHPISVKDLSVKLGARLQGDDSIVITGINVIHKVEKGDLTFVDEPKYFRKSLQSSASVILINQEVDCPTGKALLICDNPFTAYNDLVKEQRPFSPLTSTISQSALIHPSTIIEPGVTIGNHVVIGKNCYLQAGCFIGDYTRIGDHVIIQAGAIVGSEAFYFQNDVMGRTKWHTGGRVVIENHVDIGAGCTISKGVSGDTLIGEGTKIDCQVHIGHGTVIGKNCLLAGQVGIGGKCVLEDNVVLYGQVGVAQRVRIGKGAVVSAKSGVSKNLEGGKVYFGIPAAEIRVRQRELAALRQLPDWMNDRKIEEE